MSSSEESDCVPTESCQDLKCTEKLDRSSPILWPKLPMEKFVHTNNVESEDSWTESSLEIKKQEKGQIIELSRLPLIDLIARAKKLQDLSYELELEEAKEISRAKYLGIFEN